MSGAVGHAAGKLLLCGEHAVVYGYPAIAMAIDRGTTVRLVPRPGPTAPTDATIDDPRLLPALHAVLPPEGYGVEIRSDLLVGRGMGSSAALAVALVRAVAALNGEVPTTELLWERAFAVERVFHGNPSGVDHAVSLRGGVLRYRRGPPPTFERLPLPSWSVVVLDSGTAGDTRELVAGVASRRPAIDPALEAIGALVDRAAAVLDDVRALGPLLTENHGLLRAIGVSTPILDDLVRVALEAGATGAKLAGAGGGGVVLALGPDPDRILEAATRRGILALHCRPVEA